MHLLNRILEALLLPPFGPLLWIAVGLVLAGRRPRLGRAIAGSAVILAMALMMPITVGALLAPLEDVPALRPDDLAGADAIVILGGGRRSPAVEYDGETVNRLTLERLRYGARLARFSGLPVLVSGGVADEHHQSEARLMQLALAEDFGVDARWVEEQSVNTRENARYSAAILGREGISHVILVTHAAHMPRARRHFERAGLRVTPAPTGFQGGAGLEDGLLAWLPGQGSSYSGWYATHEWVGLLQQRLAALTGG